ncbi:FAD-dependent monooxygenase [Mesorhizobium sp. PUT5]|uniref:FAD-dependent monooxygenase n=1 Tax=Mesorhizobium sp. PUT5 TaxID=3454629 RepID=UPI003FA46274
MGTDERPILIAGAGVAGLTAALAFARQGFQVRIFERVPELEPVGAGLQLSPNAARILRRLGVLDAMGPVAVRPGAVVLKDAASLRELARVPLGEAAERRWGAPYLVAHRADLQKALLTCVGAEPAIELVLGASLQRAETSSDGVNLSIEAGGSPLRAQGVLLVGADGVWSTARGFVDGRHGKSRFAGELAWRTTVPAQSPAGGIVSRLGGAGHVLAFLHPGFHLIAYPVSGGAAFNLVAFTKGERIAESWSGEADPEILSRAMRGTAPELARLAGEAAPWLAWPLHTVDPRRPWTLHGGIALIGDAAHAMTPFAAQGAAMAIEDAETLAHAVAAARHGPANALAGWERDRKPRVAKVARRGALNHLAWHAAGPVALARDLVLKLRSPDSLAADLDWLYGWRAPQDVG